MWSIHDTLVRLRERVSAGDIPSPELGICSNVLQVARSMGRRDLVGDFDDWLPEAFETWPEFSGNLGYPVKFPTLEGTVTPFVGYHDTPDKWVYEYGAARLRLLDHLIDLALTQGV